MKKIEKLYLVKLLACAFSLLLIFACSSDSDDSGGNTGGGSTNSLNTVTVNLSDIKQEIKGFGSCNTVFNGVGSFPSEVDIQKGYGMGDNELGLSIFRISVPAEQTTWADVAQVAKYAQDRGAIIFASPWNAPDDMLDPNATERVILPEKYDDYVAHLNSYDTFMSNNGVNLHAISIQNEPDIGEWSQWTIDEIFDFTKNHANGINTTVISAESFNFNRSYYNDILNDTDAASNIDIVGGHIYGGGQGDFILAESKNKEIWMTEYLLNDYTAPIDGTANEGKWGDVSDNVKWDQSMDMLKTVHTAMISNWNAYIWWYLKRYYSFIGEGEKGSVNGEITKRGWAFSQYSKFIRPGYKRVSLDIDSSTGIELTAYKSNDKVVLVILNPDSFTTSSKISLDGVNISSGKSYVTNITQNRTENTLTITDNIASVTILGKSVTTVVLEI